MRSAMISTGISSNLIQYGRIVALDANTATNSMRVLPSSQTAGVVMSTMIVGIAAEAYSSNDSTGANDHVLSFWAANPMVEFRAQTQGAALASSLVGAVKAIVWDSTLTIHKIDATNSTTLNVRALVTQLIDNIGDTGGAVAFRFLTNDKVNATNTLLAFHT